MRDILSRLDRRCFLRGTASLGALCAGFGSAWGGEPGLGTIAASKGLLFGSLMRLPLLKAGGAYTQVMLRECTLYTCAEMHWRLVSPSPDATDFSKTDPAEAWAHAHGMRFRGHSLLWHRQVPAWFERLPNRDAAVAAVQEHIRIMCTHFGGKMQSWDVVNEALPPISEVSGLRKSVFLEKIGPEYLDIAFHAAREADRNALLVLNDYGLEYEGSLDRQRILLQIVDGFKRRNTPIDAIGIQSHLVTKNIEHLSQRSLANFLKEISDRGLKILVTELDVNDRASPSDIPTRDAQVAAVYERYLDAVLDNRAVIAVITWALGDRDSWITQGYEKSFLRDDRLPARPLPFDDHYAPKPAYYAIVDALKAAPAR